MNRTGVPASFRLRGEHVARKRAARVKRRCFDPRKSRSIHAPRGNLIVGHSNQKQVRAISEAIVLRQNLHFCRLKVWQPCALFAPGARPANGSSNPRGKRDRQGSPETPGTDDRDARLLLSFRVGHRYIEGVIKGAKNLSSWPGSYVGHTTKSPNLCIIDCASGFSENVSDPCPQVIRNFWRFFEMNNFSRATSAFVLTASLLVSSVAAVGANARPQNRPTTLKRPAKLNPIRKRKRIRNKAEPKKTAAQFRRQSLKSSDKPLSTNEDPDMIGKRNINTGIIAKMSGSTEKEVRHGT